MKKARVYCDTNLTPINGPNPAWVDDGHQKDPDVKGNPRLIRNAPTHDFMVGTLGFERMFMVYDGTLNRAPTWCSDDLTFNSGPLKWEREGNYSAPPQEKQVRMCAKLSSDAKHFWPDATSIGSTSSSSTSTTISSSSSSLSMSPSIVQSTVGSSSSANLSGASLSPEPLIPMIFDLENSSFDGSPASIDRLTQALQWSKQQSQFLPVGSFAWPAHANTEAAFNSSWKAFAETTSFVAPGFYDWNVPALSPHRFFGFVEESTALLDRFYSFLPRIAVITPTYQIWWNDHTLASLNGKYIPFELWQKILQFLADRNYDLFLWMSDIVMDDTAKKYLNEAAKYKL